MELFSVVYNILQGLSNRTGLMLFIVTEILESWRAADWCFYSVSATWSLCPFAASEAHTYVGCVV